MLLFSVTPFRGAVLGVLLGLACGNPLRARTVTLSLRDVGFQVIPDQLLGLAELDTTCEQVLRQQVKCETDVAELGQREYHGSLEDVSLTDAVCAPSCKASLNTARRRAAGACAKTPELLPGITILSILDAIISGWEETCLKDKESGKYCNDVIESWDEVEDIKDMPKTELCSYCYAAKLRLMQKSEYSAYDEYFAAMLEYVNKECGVEGPTTPLVEPPRNNGSNPSSCVSGKTIVTQTGDSCDSIARDNSISSASLYYINANLPDCNNVEAGLQLCLPQSCATYTVNANDTCVEIGVNTGTSWSSIVDWNLMLDSRCSNLWGDSPFWGHVICVSAPGGDFVDEGSGGSGTGPGNGNSGGEGGSGDGYSNIVVEPPGTVGKGTTNSCGAYVQAKPETGCAKMIVRAHRATPMDLFLEVNPSLGTAAECDDNLKVGVWYCLSPHYGWKNE